MGAAMSDDRLAQARAEAWKRYPEEWDPYNEESVDDWGYSSAQRLAFQRGVEWADAHPHVTPEALVVAYEDGQRDAVSKGLAKARITGVAWADDNPQPRTITRAQFEKAFEARFTPDPVIGMNVLGFLRELGIEVRDE